MPAPEKINEEVRVKLQYAASLDATLEEMAFFCGVTRQTLYNWFEKYPDLFDEIERLRQKPVFAARERVVKGIPESYGNAIDFLSRKRKNEFSQRNEHTGAEGEPLFNNEQKEKADKAIESYLGDSQ